MNAAFSQRMLDLRKKKNISQKDAAQSLGVSQALLSHYEKGIRECGLDFLVKAAAYYDVSTDYLLGLSETERQFKENFEDEDFSLDAEFRTSTLFRAASMLSDDFAKNGPEKTEQAKHFFALCIYRLAVLAAGAGYIPKSWINMSVNNALAQSKASLELVSKSLISETQEKTVKNIRQPLCIKTVISTAEHILIKNAKSVANINLDS